jgi:outer membrane protein OmpA-like peptidoglycan-associated protein
MPRSFVQFAMVSTLAAELLLAARAMIAQTQNADPDSPQMQTAAHNALVNAKVLDIVGVTMGIDATLKDLNAKVTDREIHVDLAADVLFDFDKFTLRPEANETLGKVGKVVANYPDAPLLIEGYTDGKGTHDYNIKLSRNRAEAVKKWLVDKAAIKASRITTSGLGEAKPVAPNRNPDGSDDPEGRQKNRRVELTLRTKS